VNPVHGLSPKRVVGYTAIVVATLALFLVAYRLRQVVLLFVLSIVVAAAFRKGVIALERRRLPRSLAILVWYLVVVGILALGIVILGSALRAELQQITERLPTTYDSYLSYFQQFGEGWQQSIAERLPDTDAMIESLGADEAAEIGFQIAGLTSGILNLVIALVGVLTLTFYWLADQEHFERLWLTLLPVQQRAIARHTWRGIEHRVGAYVRSEAAQFVLSIAVLWLAFRLLGTPYPALYALYGGVVQLIPWVGIPLTLLPLLLMVFTGPWWLILATAALIILVGAAMDQLLEPRLRGDAIVHPILTVLALMIMGEASGILGMLIALPLAATFQIVLSELILVNTSPKSLAVALESAQLQELRARIERLREAMPDDPEQRREAEGLMARVRALMNSTEEVVRERIAADEHARTTAGGPRRPPLLQRAKPS
jgi:predicted PurR-regulated permease PerM